jgi:hypothetical protein
VYLWGRHHVESYVSVDCVVGNRKVAELCSGSRINGSGIDGSGIDGSGIDDCGIDDSGIDSGGIAEGRADGGVMSVLKVKGNAN